VVVVVVLPTPSDGWGNGGIPAPTFRRLIMVVQSPLLFRVVGHSGELTFPRGPTIHPVTPVVRLTLVAAKILSCFAYRVDFFQACPFWSPWSEYSSCTVTCGGGSQARSRQCINGEIGEVGCLGDSVEDALCNSDVSNCYFILAKWHLYGC